MKLTQALTDSGFTQSKHDYSLFTKSNNGNLVVILIYVDDLLITRSDLQEINVAKQSLHRNFKMKDLGELSYFLGIKLARSNEGILMSRRKYALEMISEAGLSGAKPKWTPME